MLHIMKKLWPSLFAVFMMVTGAYAEIDIRNHGAICDGVTNDLQAIERAAASDSHILLPAKTLCILDGSGSWVKNTIPANLIIEGENWESCIIKAANPDENWIRVGQNTVMLNVAFWHKMGTQILTELPGGINQPLPIRRYANNTPTFQIPTNWYRHDRHVDQGDITRPRGGGDWPATSVANWGEGDCYWAGALNKSACFRADVQAGTGFFAPLGSTYPAGCTEADVANGIGGCTKATNGSAYAAHISSRTTKGTGTKAHLLHIEPWTDLPSIEIIPRAPTKTDIFFASTDKVEGSFLNLFHSTSKWLTGAAIYANLGYDDGNGVSDKFDGKFWHFLKDSGDRGYLDHNGDLWIAGTFRASGQTPGFWLDEKGADNSVYAVLHRQMFQIQCRGFDGAYKSTLFYIDVDSGNLVVSGEIIGNGVNLNQKILKLEEKVTVLEKRLMTLEK